MKTRVPKVTLGMQNHNIKNENSVKIDHDLVEKNPMLPGKVVIHLKSLTSETNSKGNLLVTTMIKNHEVNGAKTKNAMTGAMIVNQGATGTKIASQEAIGTKIVNQEATGTKIVNQKANGTMTVNQEVIGTTIVSQKVTGTTKNLSKEMIGREKLGMTRVVNLIRKVMTVHLRNLGKANRLSQEKVKMIGVQNLMKTLLKVAKVSVQKKIILRLKENFQRSLIHSLICKNRLNHSA